MEEIVLCDEAGIAIGTAPKLAAHHAHTPLHLAFSCYIFDRSGRLLVTRRATSKKVWPGVWTNSVCGHPAPGEDLSAAVRRRAAFELGMTLRELHVALPAYRYESPPFDGIVENEFCPVHVAVTDDQPRLNHDEVAEWRWMGWDAFVAEALADGSEPPEWSWWCKDQIAHLRSLERFVAV